MRSFLSAFCVALAGVSIGLIAAELSFPIDRAWLSQLERLNDIQARAASAGIEVSLAPPRYDHPYREPRIQSLRFGWGATDQSVAQLEKLGLEYEGTGEVELWSPKLTDAGVREFVARLDARKLTLISAIINGSGLAAWSPRNLEEVRIVSDSPVAFDLAFLGRCQSLKRVSLEGDGFTDASLASIQDALPSRVLIEASKTRITSAGVSSFEAAHPGLRFGVFQDVSRRTALSRWLRP